MVDASGAEDPGECVIDEVAGQWLALVAAPLDPLAYAFAKAQHLLLEDDGRETVLWAPETAPAGAIAQVVRCFVKGAAPAVLRGTADAASAAPGAAGAGGSMAGSGAGPPGSPATAGWARHAASAAKRAPSAGGGGPAESTQTRPSGASSLPSARPALRALYSANASSDFERS